MVDSSGCGPSERDSDYDTFTDDVDQCPDTPFQETAKVDSTGCAPSEIDLDGDGVTSDLDWDDENPDQWLDSDNDGIGDNAEVDGGDDCPSKFGTSSLDRSGCLDSDGDGWSDETASWSSSDGADVFPYDNTQWNDTDADGFGDNWDDPSWNTSRIGELVDGATTPDMCPEEYSAFVYPDYFGCLVKYNPEDVDQGPQTNPEDTGGVSPVVLFSIGGGGLVLILIGAIAMLLRKKPKRKIPRPVEKQMSTFEGEPTLEIPQNTASPAEPVTSVSTWEGLPPGEWLDPDENGTNWYLDDDGRHWYSDDDGFHVWQQ